jgi:hypothetical protein
MQLRRCGCWRSALFSTSVRRLVLFSGRTSDIIHGGFLKHLAWAGDRRGEDPVFLLLFPVDETHRQESCIGPEGEPTPPPQEVAGFTPYHFRESVQGSLHLAMGRSTMEYRTVAPK